MADLKRLKPKVRRLADRLALKCAEEGIAINITCGYRSILEQDKLYSIGRTAPGKKVTNARGGQSFHNFGVAFDFCPLVRGKPCWTDLRLFDRVGKIGKSLGLEWGGDWIKFPDLPHFEYTAGYCLKDFQANKVDWNRFE